MFPLSWGCQSWAQHSRGGLTSAGWELGTMFSACWQSCSCSPGCSGPSLQRFGNAAGCSAWLQHPRPFQPRDPGIYWCLGLLLPAVGLCQPISPSCGGWQQVPLSCAPAVALCPTMASVVEVFDCTEPRTDPCHWELRHSLTQSSRGLWSSQPLQRLAPCFFISSPHPGCRFERSSAAFPDFLLHLCDTLRCSKAIPAKPQGFFLEQQSFSISSLSRWLRAGWSRINGCWGNAPAGGTGSRAGRQAESPEKGCG